jgi:four helix bundle protein
MDAKPSIIQQKSFDFSIRVIKMYQWLCDKHKIYSLADQFLRSGTSIGANVEEATGSISKREFAMKIGISYKEARETRYWIRLFGSTGYLDEKTFQSILGDCDELVKILGSIQKSTYQNLEKERLEKSISKKTLN